MDQYSISLYLSQEVQTLDEILATPIAISDKAEAPAVIFDRQMRNLPLTADLSEQAQLQDVLNLIGSEQYRRRLPAGVNTAKGELWMAAPGITHGDRTKADNPQKARRPGQPSGILQIDIDHFSTDIVELQDCQEKLMEIPCVICTFISPSHNGVKALVLLDKPTSWDDAKDMGIMASKAICDYLDIIGYTENKTKTAENNYSLLPDELKNRFGEAHIDFSVASNPKKGLFIPVAASNLLYQEKPLQAWISRGNDPTCTGWYYQGVDHPFERQRKTAETTTISTLYNNSSVSNSSVALSRGDRYARAAIEDELNQFANAAPGSHHQAAIQLGRTIHKFSQQLDVDDVFARADAIIDNWCPPASNPDLEKQTLRDMKGYQRVFEASSLTNSNPRQQVQPRFEESTVCNDICNDDQPTETTTWPEMDVARLMAKTFLKGYRKLKSGEGVRLSNGEILSVSQMDDILSYIWYYTDNKNNLHKITLRQALALVRDSEGKVTVTPVYCPELKHREICDLKPEADSVALETCINLSAGVPTFGENLEKLATPVAREEAKIIADFATGRFIDRESYPDEDEAQKHAIQESAYYFRYVSQAVLDPADKPPCAMAMLSLDNGTGKSTLTADIPWILADGCYSEIKQTKVKNESSLRFAWSLMQGRVFTVFDDFKDPPMSLAAELRNLITSSTLQVEKKGKNITSDTNYARLLVSTNSAEFMTELNRGVKTERRWHLFSIKNVLLGDSTCDAAMGIIKKYIKLMKNKKVLTHSDPQLQAFRAALILEFSARASAYEASGGVIRLEQALETAEFLRQKALGVSHGKEVRAAGVILSEANAFGEVLAPREFYRRIREKTRVNYTDGWILQHVIKDTGWFRLLKTNGSRRVIFTEAGSQEWEEKQDKTCQLLDNFDSLSTHEKMELLGNLSASKEIETVMMPSQRVAVTVKSTCTEYVLDLRDYRDKKVLQMPLPSTELDKGIEEVFDMDRLYARN